MVATTVKKFRPSNGTEGAVFIDVFCATCARDISLDCQILADTLMYDVDDAKYPAEWCYKGNIPCCTAYVPEDDPVPHRCEKTIDMFGDLP